MFLLPIGVFVALITDPMLRWHLARRALRRREKSALQPALIAPPDTASSFVRSNPLAVALSRGQALRPGGGISAPSASDIDAAAVLAPAAPPGDDPTLAPFLSEYLYAAWWFKHVDLGTLAGTAVQVRISKPLSKVTPLRRLRRPSSSGYLAGRAPSPRHGATGDGQGDAVLHRARRAPRRRGAAAAVFRDGESASLRRALGTRAERPPSGPSQDAWKGPVKVALVLLSMSCVALNASATTVDIMEGAGQSAASLIQSVSVGSYLLFVACVATAVVLVGSFARTLVVAAREEQEGMAARRDPREKRVQRLKGTLAPLSMGAPLSTHPRLDVHAPPGALRLTAAHLDRARSDSSRVAALFQQPGSPPLASARVGWGATPTAAFRGGRRLSTRAGVASSVRQMHAALSAESGHSREPRPSETVAGASGLQY